MSFHLLLFPAFLRISVLLHQSTYLILGKEMEAQELNNSPPPSHTADSNSGSRNVS